MLSQDVRLSVTHWYSVETAEHVLKLFSPSDSHTAPVSPYQTVWQYSDRDPHNGGIECRGMKKIGNFCLYIFSLKAYPLCDSYKLFEDIANL